MFNISVLRTMRIVVSTLRQEGINPPTIATVFGAVADDELNQAVRQLKQRVADVKADILGPPIPGVDDRPDNAKGKRFVRSANIPAPDPDNGFHATIAQDWNCP